MPSFLYVDPGQGSDYMYLCENSSGNACYSPVNGKFYPKYDMRTQSIPYGTKKAPSIIPSWKGAPKKTAKSVDLTKSYQTHMSATGKWVPQIKLNDAGFGDAFGAALSENAGAALVLGGLAALTGIGLFTALRE